MEAQRKLPDVVLVNRDGPIVLPPYYPLAVDKVHYVGEAVVLVVAETLTIARDAAELIDVDYEPQRAVVDTAEAPQPDAPPLRDHPLGNILLDSEIGDAAATERRSTPPPMS